MSNPIARRLGITKTWNNNTFEQKFLLGYLKALDIHSSDIYMSTHYKKIFLYFHSYKKLNYINYYANLYKLLSTILWKNSTLNWVKTPKPWSHTNIYLSYLSYFVSLRANLTLNYKFQKLIWNPRIFKKNIEHIENSIPLLETDNESDEPVNISDIGIDWLNTMRLINIYYNIKYRGLNVYKLRFFNFQLNARNNRLTIINRINNLNKLFIKKINNLNKFNKNLNNINKNGKILHPEFYKNLSHKNLLNDIYIKDIRVLKFKELIEKSAEVAKLIEKNIIANYNQKFYPLYYKQFQSQNKINNFTLKKNYNNSKFEKKAY